MRGACARRVRPATDAPRRTPRLPGGNCGASCNNGPFCYGVRQACTEFNCKITGIRTRVVNLCPPAAITLINVANAACRCGDVITNLISTVPDAMSKSSSGPLTGLTSAVIDSTSRAAQCIIDSGLGVKDNMANQLRGASDGGWNIIQGKTIDLATYFSLGNKIALCGVSVGAKASSPNRARFPTAAREYDFVRRPLRPLFKHPAAAPGSPLPTRPSLAV